MWKCFKYIPSNISYIAVGRIGTYKEEHAAVSQVAMGVVKNEKIIASKIHEKEIDTGTIENELARVKIDMMNTTVRCSQLKDCLIDEIDDLNEKDKAVVKLQVEICRSNDDVEKKMKKVDNLNKKYEQMAKDIGEEEPLGPLEANIKSLENDIEIMDGNSRRLQEEWVANQAKLIESSEKTETFEAEKLQKRAIITILKQKRLRLVQNIHTNKASLREILARTKNMHNDMSRLNELIGRHLQMRAKLINDNGISDIEFTEEFMEIQSKLWKIKAKNDHAQSAKEELLKQIMEKEKEILVWEKKIQLEKETQIALNSSDHAVEIKGMEIEIHRMSHRLEEINRHQEKLIRDMELTIHKREDIAVKYQNTKQGHMHGTHPQTMADAKKTLGDLKRQIKRKSNEKEVRKSLYHSIFRNHFQFIFLLTRRCI
jgi:chromosome segregation ATPase